MEYLLIIVVVNGNENPKQNPYTDLTIVIEMTSLHNPKHKVIMNYNIVDIIIVGFLPLKF